jgi:hypothetical protein
MLGICGNISHDFGYGSVTSLSFALGNITITVDYQKVNADVDSQDQLNIKTSAGTTVCTTSCGSGWIAPG